MTSDTRRISRGTDAWPSALDEVQLGVEQLYLRGKPIPSKDRTVAIVGTRRPTAAGIEAARTFTKGLVEAGFAIVSGLALGIDSIAHKVALEHQGHTIAVLGCGADVVYPKKNVSLKAHIERRGTVVSEYPDGTPSAAWRFPERNRIIAGLASAVLVVEGSFKSGALITGRLGFDLGRTVFAVPGSIRNPMAAGPNELIRTDVARLVTEVKHITDELAPSLVFPTESDSGEWQVALDDGERVVLDLLDDAPVTTDFVCAETGMGVGEAAISLSRLEVRSLVRRTPRGYELTERGARVRVST